MSCNLLILFPMWRNVPDIVAPKYIKKESR